MSDYKEEIVDKVLEYLKSKQWFKEFDRRRLFSNYPMDIRDWLLKEEEHNELMNIISNAFPWTCVDYDYWKHIEDDYKKWLIKNDLIMPQVIMTNEEYYTLKEIYQFLEDNKDTFTEEPEKIKGYINILKAIVGDYDSEEIIQ